LGRLMNTNQIETGPATFIVNHPITRFGD
jgi:hypothetical protein